MTIKHYKYLKILFLSLYLIFGSYNSIKVGISHDEYHEQKNWEYNVKIFKKSKKFIYFVIFFLLYKLMIFQKNEKKSYQEFLK